MLKKVLIGGGVITIITLLGVHLYKQYKLLLACCYKFEKFRIAKINKGRFVFEVMLKIRNQSDIDIGTIGYNFKIYINNKFVFNAFSNKEQMIKAKSVSDFSILIDFNPQNFFTAKEIINLISVSIINPSQFIIKVDGKVNVKHSFIKLFRLPISFEMNLLEVMLPDGTQEICKI